MYIIIIILFILNTIQYFFSKNLFADLTTINVVSLLVLVITLIILNKIVKHKKYYATVSKRILAYRFKSKFDMKYSAIIIIISTIFALRVLRLLNPTDLNLIIENVYQFYQRTNLLICLYNITLISLCLIILIFILKIIKKYLNIHISKIHFYMLSYPKYIKIHNFIRDKITIEHLIMLRINTFFFNLKSVIVFGYIKNLLTRYSKKTDPLNKKDFWTQNDKKKYDIFVTKYEKAFLFVEKLIRHMLYHLHIFTFLILLILDIKYNKALLTYTSSALPILFFYQLYVTLCKFIHDKITYDICEEINLYYYQKVEIIDEKAMLVNGELYEIPKEFPAQFLDYEACEFYYSLYLKKRHDS